MEKFDQQFFSSFEKLPIASFLIDGQGNILNLNIKMTALVRAGRAEESVGTNILRYKTYKDAGLLPYIQKALQGEYKQVPKIIQTLQSHPGEFCRNYCFIPLKKNDGQQSGAMITVEDRECEDTFLDSRNIYKFRERIWQLVLERGYESEKELIESLLRLAGEQIMVSRVSLLPYDQDKHGYVSRYEWKNDKEKSHLGAVVPKQWVDIVKGPAVAAIPRDLEKFSHILPYQIIQKAVLKFLSKLGVRSALIVPYGDKNEPEGILTYTQSDYEREWQEGEIDILIEIGKILKLRLQQIRQEQKLKQNEEKFKTLFDKMPAAVYLHDFKGTILDGNRAAEELIGYKKEEMVGKSFFTVGLLNKEFIGVMARAIKRLAQGQEAGWMQYRIKSKSGREKVVEANSFPIKLEGRNVVLGIARDITEKNLLQESARHNLDMMQSVFEANVDGIVLSDDEGKVKIVNQKFRDMWAFPENSRVEYADETLAHMKKMIMPAEDFEQKIQIILSHKDSESYDVLKLRDGRVFERITIPQIVEGKAVGRLWSFRDVTGKRHVEESLKASQDRYKQIFDTAANMIISVSREGIIVDCNKKVKDYLGYEPAEVVGLPLAKIIHPRDMGKMQQSLISILESGSALNKEYRMVHKDKKTTFVNINSSALKDEDGHYYRIICMVEDVTRQREAERKIKEQEKNFKAILDTVPHAIIGLEDRQIVFASAGTKKVFGYEPKDIIGYSTRIFYRSHEDYRRIADAIYPRLQERATYALDFPCVTKQGKPIECLVSAARTVGFEKKQSVVVMYEDITARKKAAQALEDSEQNYRAIFDSVSDGIMVHEPDSTCFIDINRSATQMFGYEPEEFKKMAVGDISEGSAEYNDDRALEIIKSAAASKEDVVVKWRFKKKDKKLFWGEVRLRTAMIAGQKRVLANISDISERIRAEEEIRRRNRELERFNDLMVGREEKMVELKKRLRELENKSESK